MTTNEFSAIAPPPKPIIGNVHLPNQVATSIWAFLVISSKSILESLNLSLILLFYPIELPLKTFGVSQPGSGVEVLSSGEGILAKGALFTGLTTGVVGTTGGIVKVSVDPD